MFTTLQPTQKQYVQSVSENNTDMCSLHCSQHRNSTYRMYQKITRRLFHQFIILQPTQKQYVQSVSENIIKTVGQFITFQRTQKQYVQSVSENNSETLSDSSLHCSQHRNNTYRVYQKITQRLCQTVHYIAANTETVRTECIRKL